MSLVGFKAGAHPQQTATGRNDPNKDERYTLWEDFDPIDAEFHFTLDVSATYESAKCDFYFDKATDGLKQSWAGETVWCNPPYSSLRPWIEKAWRSEAKTVVMLIPANRTEQPFWADLIEPYRDRPGSVLTTRFLKGRRDFGQPGNMDGKYNSSTPFGLVLLIWRFDAKGTP